MVKVEIQSTVRKGTATIQQDPLPPYFTNVASNITGDDDPPLWLVEHFERWATSLAMDRGIAAIQPTKATMRKNLQAVEDAANTLIDALNDGAMRGFLDEAPEEIPYHGHMDHMLRDLARRAEESIVSLSTADRTTKPGRKKAMPRRASHPKSYCAALIAEAWAYFHGGDPPPRNRDAAAAADALWRAVGGEAKGWGNDPLNAWRPYFKKAQEPALTTTRAEIRRHMKEAAHFAAIRAGK